MSIEPLSYGECRFCGQPLTVQRAKFCCDAHRNAANQREFRKRHPDRKQTPEQRAAIRYSHQGTVAEMLYGARQRARRFGVPFELTHDWVEERVVSGVCEVTGLPFERERRGFRERSPFTPSIDRVEKDKGYVPSNCRVVVWIFNQARGTFSDEDVLKMARALVMKQA